MSSDSLEPPDDIEEMKWDREGPLQSRTSPIKMEPDEILKLQDHEGSMMIKKIAINIKPNNVEETPTTASSSQFKCEYVTCGDLFVTKEHLKDHIKRIHNIDLFFCDFCRYTTKYEINLSLHFTTSHHDNTTERFKCRYCDLKFKLKHFLNKHKVKCFQFKCSFCSAMFHESRSLSVHITMTHERRLKCREYSSGCSKQSYSSDHIKTPSNPHIICFECTASFKTQKDFYNHLKSHTGLKDYKCIQCDSTFNRLDILLEHIKLHTLFTNYKCDQCDAEFTNKNDLQTHIRTQSHHNRIPKQCSMKFKEKNDLYRHLRSHAVRPRRFICNYCGLSYAAKRSLVDHILAHSGDKSVKCDKCNTTFACPRNLKRHIILRHHQSSYSNSEAECTMTKTQCVLDDI